MGAATLSYSAVSLKVAPRRSALEVLITLLVPAGLVGSWVAAVASVESAIVAVDADGYRKLIENKTALYYAAHALDVGAIMAAAVLAVICGRSRRLGMGARIGLYVSSTVAIAWALLAYKPGEMFSSDIFGGTGPFVWLSLLVAAAGVDRRIWIYLDRTIRWLAYATTLLTIRALLEPGYGYYRGYSKYIMCASLLTWLGGWTLLTATRLTGWRLFARALPAVAVLPAALAAQARSWTIVGVLLLMAFVLLRARDRGNLLSGVRSLALGLALFAAFGAIFYAAAPHALNRGMSGLVARATDDTRSGQYVAFFENVPLSDLVLGRGPKGTWYWPGTGEYKYFDNGYLWIVFQAGIPMLACYLAVLIWPAYRVARKKAAGMDAAAAFLVLVWALCMTGVSTFVIPSVELPSYLVCLFAGRCWLFLAEERARGLLAQHQSTFAQVQTATSWT